MSIVPPRIPAADSTNLRAPSGEDRSAATNATSAWGARARIARRAASPRSWARPLMTTYGTPASAIMAAVAKPIPDELPVTRARLPSSPLSILIVSSRDERLLSLVRLMLTLPLRADELIEGIASSTSFAAVHESIPSPGFTHLDYFSNLALQAA